MKQKEPEKPQIPEPKVAKTKTPGDIWKEILHEIQVENEVLTPKDRNTDNDLKVVDNTMQKPTKIQVNSNFKLKPEQK